MHFALKYKLLVGGSLAGFLIASAGATALVLYLEWISAPVLMNIIQLCVAFWGFSAGLFFYWIIRNRYYPMANPRQPGRYNAIRFGAIVVGIVVCIVMLLQWRTFYWQRINSLGVDAIAVVKEFHYSKSKTGRLTTRQAVVGYSDKQDRYYQDEISDDNLEIGQQVHIRYFGPKPEHFLIVGGNPGAE